MAQLITRDELALVLDEDIPVDRFEKLYSRALGVIRTGYSGDPEAATGRALDVVTNVAWSVIVRILSNPKGARSVGLGSANVTFGGQDTDVSNIFALTDTERDDLSSVSETPTQSSAFTIRARRS